METGGFFCVRVWLEVKNISLGAAQIEGSAVMELTQSAAAQSGWNAGKLSSCQGLLITGVHQRGCSWWRICRRWLRLTGTTSVWLSLFILHSQRRSYSVIRSVSTGDTHHTQSRKDIFSALTSGFNYFSRERPNGHTRHGSKSLFLLHDCSQPAVIHPAARAAPLCEINPSW